LAVGGGADEPLSGDPLVLPGVEPFVVVLGGVVAGVPPPVSPPPPPPHAVSARRNSEHAISPSLLLIFTIFILRGGDFLVTPLLHACWRLQYERQAEGSKLVRAGWFA